MKIPMMIEMNMKTVLVIGGGQVGFRKSMKLTQYGAEVVCLSLEHIQEFENLAACWLIQDAYNDNYLIGQEFVVAATSDPIINRQIIEDCKKRNLLCMAVDAEAVSDVSFMATSKKEGLTIAVSTEGQSPGFSKRLVQQLMDKVDLEEFQRLQLIGELRSFVLQSTKTKDEKKEILNAFQTMSLEVLQSQYKVIKSWN